MSEVTEVNSTETQPTLPITENGYSFEVVGYREKSSAEGFKFTTIVFASVAAAIAHLGEKVVLEIINDDTCNNIAMAARRNADLLGKIEPNDMPAKRNAVLAKFPDGVIFSAQDALNWKPAERRFSVTGLQKEMNALLKAGKAAEAMVVATKLVELLAAQAE